MFLFWITTKASTNRGLEVEGRVTERRNEFVTVTRLQREDIHVEVVAACKNSTVFCICSLKP